MHSDICVAIMDIKSFLPGKDEKKEYYWSVVLEPGWVQAGIWRIEGDKAQVVLSSPTFAWELEEELVSAVDNALSSAIQTFPEDIQEPQKTVFGVSTSWVKGGEISQEYLDKIKILCTELSLKPIGFVVLPEAIAHYIKFEEGGTLTAVVLGVYKQSLEISLFRLGTLVGTTTVARSVSIVDDVMEGIVRFSSAEHIPSRFIVYDGKEGELEEARQALLKVNWEDFGNLKLLHTPKVEIFNTDTKIYAVCLAGASELGDIKGIVVTIEGDENIEEKTKSLPVEDISKHIATPIEELGFVTDKDIAEETRLEAGLGKVEQKPEVELTPEREITDIHQNVSAPANVERRKIKFPEKHFLIFNKVSGNISSLMRKFKPPKLTFAASGEKVFVFGIGFLLLIAILGFLAWWFYPKAVVTVYVSPKRLDERFSLTVDKGSDPSNYSDRLLAGHLLEETFSGEKTKQTSGTKTVGDKAKGEVTIYRVGGEISLANGTILSGPDNLKFTLEEDVVVASGSAGSPGTTKTKVAAGDIGAGHNLAAGGTFRVGNYSTIDMEAKNESAFSGGSSREINAVSEEDQEGLQQELEDELKANAVEAFKKELKDEDYFIEKAIETTTSDKTFSAKIGDEASNLKLTLDLDAKALLVNKNELTDLTKDVLKDKIPQGFNLRGEQIEYDFGLDGHKDDKYELDVRISANLLPVVEMSDIAQKIRGKNPEIAKEFMNKEVPGFVRAEIRVKPSFPGKLKTLPHVAKNIEVELAADR
ncbi:MAG: hypothetical protein US60_C0048G0004 [Microgenomates group bacterium GW2011_GWC1_37_8]|uniref:Baseplate protein J-like domain-containing protein n=1 Tax=Candidatus Woesebacteria bacterium GW2011_GWB1_38_8 TaxID=1618570 RepID=A0A0G0L4T5_9BACT|nr:MAG: hypothetical protein US60_C0048G0004 [Microgenomates group bacterium GW2011_GWC1_37_8]KKQ86042.1 MAG: hypothetical protein UT08_C0002G0064 [Candidatus Woesebacteria bacterium GW2011_GWB1_38_8]